MRITNRMMTNNLLSNINRNKYNMTDLEQQYSSGKKIQRPSDDPIVAVRALKLRTSLSELKQYHEKNIPDAMSWMDITGSALSTVNEILRQINTYCVQGSSDTLTAKDRGSIVQNLQQMKSQIHQEGNANFAGRYVFTGFKTDTPLTFMEDSNDIQYTITEKLISSQIQTKAQVVGGYRLDDFYNPDVDFEGAPTLINSHRIQLSYGDLDNINLTDQTGGIRYSIRGADGELVEQAPIPVKMVSMLDADAYTPGPGEVHFVYDSGELILGEERYNDLQQADEIEFTYSKTNFTGEDLRPEHYFDCVTRDLLNTEQEPIRYEKSKQEIQYEVNYNQMLTVNTEASSAISHEVGRLIEDIFDSVEAVNRMEESIKEVENRLENVDLPLEEKQRYEKMLDRLETQLELKKEVMQKAFSRGITMTDRQQDKVNAATADLGSRYVRLQLTENRLSGQKTEMEELLSLNEDADLVETIIRFNAAQVIYNASLSAASKVVQNSLLDFLR